MSEVDDEEDFWSKLRCLHPLFSLVNVSGLSVLSEILGEGQDKPPWTASPTPCQYITQLNIWSRYLRNWNKFISLSTKYSCSRWCNKICCFSFLSEILGGGGGGGRDKPPRTACPPTHYQYVTQLNVWSNHLRLTEIKFIFISTKYSCSRWCNNIYVLSILSEILDGGQDKPPWTACPPPLVNT